MKNEPSKFETEITPFSAGFGGVGGLVLLVITLICAPPLLFFLVPAVVFLVVLFMLGQRNEKKALAIARSHLLGGSSAELSEPVGADGSLVLTDWGIVYIKSGKRPIEIAWDSVNTVRETGVGVLTFQSLNDEFRLDLSQARFLYVCEFIQQRIGKRAQFDVDPVTGESQIVSRLASSPRVCGKGKNRLIIAADFLEYKGIKLPWTDIVSVVEHSRPVVHAREQRWMSFTAADKGFEIFEDAIEADGELPLSTSFDFLRAVVFEIIPQKAKFEKEPLTPRLRAYYEFERVAEQAKLALSFSPKKKGSYELILQRYKIGMNLIDKYKLDGVLVNEFLENYAKLFKLAGQSLDAERIETRIRKLNEHH